MYLVPEDSISFPKIMEVQPVDFLDRFPNDARLVDVQGKLEKILMVLKEKIDEDTYKDYIKSLNQKFANFKSYINGNRNPPLGFIKNLQRITKTLNIDFKLEKYFEGVKVKFGHGGNAATAQLPTVITSELAYLVGAMRDGTLARYGKYEISYSQNNTEWLKVLQILLIKVFRPSNMPVIRNNRVTLSNRPIFEYFHRIFDVPIGRKDLWRTPKIIKNSSTDIQRYYIRGFYDADGLSWKLGFCQANRDAIVFVKRTLENLGIKTGKLSIRKVEGKKPLYMFNTSKKSHIHFIRLVGSLNPSKQKLFLPI